MLILAFCVELYPIRIRTPQLPGRVRITRRSDPQSITSNQAAAAVDVFLFRTRLVERKRLLRVLLYSNSGLIKTPQCPKGSFIPGLLGLSVAVQRLCDARKSLSEGCTLTGRLLRQAIGWAGKAFAALMSLQRVVTVQLDRSASRLGQLLTGSVPIVGQALSSAADAVLAGMRLLKSTLGIAALLSIGAEFVPLYLGLLVHLFFLSCCSWLAGIGGLEHCHKLLQCFAEAVSLK